MSMNESKEKVFVGVDVSKNTLDVRIEPLGESLRVANDDAGIARLYARLREVSPTLIVMSVCRIGSPFSRAARNVTGL